MGYLLISYSRDTRQRRPMDSAMRSRAVPRYYPRGVAKATRRARHGWCGHGALGLVTFAGMFASRGSSAECRLSASQHAHLDDDVTISAGSATFPLGLEGVPVEIVVEPGTARAKIQVEAPLEFDATYPVADLRLRVTKTVDLYGGRVRVGRGMGPILQRVEGDAMRISLTNMLGVEVSGTLAIPCRSIGLENPPLVLEPRRNRTTEGPDRRDRDRTDAVVRRTCSDGSARD